MDVERRLQISSEGLQNDKKWKQQKKTENPR